MRESIYIPKLLLEELSQPEIDPKSLTTIQEAPTSQTCQTKTVGAHFSFRTSTTQPNSKSISLERAKAEAAILNDPNLDPADQLTRASALAYLQTVPQESPL
jgi:hypothetical protein